ncbi:MAG: type III toxin-antitoxin system ToxN/AbiQ family toxin [Atopobiaceae bacterium]|nr:type III toxin-antitoxin system ToxN/AbiQ family toxin [Atopobiaceae bacterium]
MEDIGIYEVSERYVDYLAPLAPHLFLNKRRGQKFSQCTYVDISKVEDPSYRSPLRAEYREIRALSGRIRKNARNLYQHKVKNGTSTRLAARCNDFKVLETACKEFM